MSIEGGGADTTNTDLTTVTSSSGAKGAWVELIASTGIGCEWMLIQVASDQGAAVENFTIDIGTGAASSEVVVVPDIVCYMKEGAGAQSYNLLVPITIASGTRISARCANTGGGSNDINVSIVISDDATQGTCSNIDAIGVASSKGAVVDPGGSANTKGAWTELVASSSNAYDWFVITVGLNENTAINATTNWLLDIGTGAAASEVVLLPDVHFASDVFEVGGSRFKCLQASIASGTRIAARAQSSNTDATDRLIDVSLLGCELANPAGGAASGARNPLVGPVG